MMEPVLESERLIDQWIHWMRRLSPFWYGRATVAEVSYLVA